MFEGFQLIYTGEKSDLPDSFPIHYYGMPDDSIYRLYPVIFKSPSGKKRKEFVIEVLTHFSFSYDKEIVYSK